MIREVACAVIRWMSVSVGVPDGHFVVPVKKDVIGDGDDFRLILHTEGAVYDGHRVTELQMLHRGNVFVFLRLPESNEGDVDGRRDAGFSVYSDIGLRPRAKLLFRRLILERGRKVDRDQHPVCIAVCCRCIHCSFRQRHSDLRLTDEAGPVRDNPGP